MLTRDEFTTGFAQRLRFVLQKHEREMAARAGGNIPMCVVNANLDAAITELADFVFDVFESKAPLEPCA
jgi:hypothetical protein